MSVDTNNLRPRGPGDSGLDDVSSGETRARKKLQKSPASDSKSQRQYTGPSNKDVGEPRSNFTSRRRPSVRDQKAPLGPRPLESSPSKLPINDNKSSLRQVPRSRQASISNRPGFNFGTNGLEQRQRTDVSTDPMQFLPAVNFDDLHTSITLEAPHLNNAPFGIMPLPQRITSNTGSELEKTIFKEPIRVSGPLENDTRIGRSSSFVRRQSIAARQNSITAAKGDVMGPPAAPQSIRNRRQSHFTTSTSSNAIARPPRKSVGPGVLGSSISEFSMFKNGNTKDRERNQFPRLRNRRSNDSTVIESDPKYLASPLNSADRDTKAKSMHSPNIIHQDYLSATTSTPESSWPARSPNRSADKGSSTPSSARRLSVMPGHASGLGARTVSPTDARRMKRMSMMPNPPPMPFTPPSSLPDPPVIGTRSAAESPSMIPRKSVTPSSNRTTPDPNRKSYNSVISNSSNTSYSSLRGQSTALRLQQSSSLSRLPTPKGRTETLASSGTDEEVPPVPAIPKAYESPKNEHEITFFSARKSSLPLDTLSVHSTSTLDYLSAQSPDKEPERFEKEVKYRRGHAKDESQANETADTSSHSSRRTLQPLRLPPLNLLPLSTPTAAKVMALPDMPNEMDLGFVTPPPKRGLKTNPSTPMTASKAIFHSRKEHRDESIPIPIQARSSSSHYIARAEASSFRAPSSSGSSFRGNADSRAVRKAVSPFISSSLPKASGEFSSLKTKSSGDRSLSNTGSMSKTSKLTGPRAQTSTKSIQSEAASEPPSISEPETPSFGTTLRRKLSLTRKRSVSKAEVIAARDAEYPPQPPEHEAMPPPRLPASAAWNGPFVTNLSTQPKSNFLHSRRKSSHPEVLIRHDRARSEVFTHDGNIDLPMSAGISTQQPVMKPVVNGSTSSQKFMNVDDVSGKSKLYGLDIQLDRDDLVAEDEMKKLAGKRKNTEKAAKELDELRRRAVPQERVSPSQALKKARLNLYERGEIVDFREVYFCGTQHAHKFNGDMTAESSNFGYDDERGDYNIVTGDHLSYRYEVVDLLGKGSFGQVVRCVDHKTGGLVAIKIIRNKKRFHQQALIEVNILQRLREWDPQSRFSMVSFTQSFYFRGHLCISTELLGMNLYEFIKIHDFKGFSLKLIRRFTKQLLNSLILLKSKKVIHCDLKPENILLAHPAQSEIKVIDFGSSCLENEKVYTYIQSRFYRSPEVILGMTYGMPIDIWSLGCILAELLTGYPIFPGENEQEQLACIMEIFGPPDKHLIEKSTRKKLFFDSLGKPRLTVSSKGKRRRPSSKTLQQALKCDDEPFLDFLTRCLRWDPERRLKPDEAIHHEFISGIKQTTTRPPRTLPSSTANYGTSPVKRFSSVHTPSSAIRPLPEPPITSIKNGMSLRTREGTGGSPSKPAPKRHSTMAANINGSVVKKGTPGPAPNSALPRLGGPRLMSSAKPDMAAAAAAVATKSR